MCKKYLFFNWFTADGKLLFYRMDDKKVGINSILKEISLFYSTLILISWGL